MQKRSLRWSESVCVLEGPDLVDAALNAGLEFEGVYIDVAAINVSNAVALSSRAREQGVRVFHLEPGVIDKIAEAQNPQPVIAAVRFRPSSLSDLRPSGLVVVLDNVRDPGNAGTVIRTADAAGAAAVVMSGHCVDPFNPKTLRASAGSVFHLPIAVTPSFASVSEWFAGEGRVTFATTVRGGQDFRRAPLGADAMIVLGNEADGLSPEAIAMCDGALSIPMSGQSESLNIAVAAGIIIFEALRQREATLGLPSSPSISTP